MKLLLSAGLSLLLLAVACKKSSPDGPLYGNWKLTVYSAGLGGGFQPGPDSVFILSLQGDHNYKSKINGDVKESGTYSVTDVTVFDIKSPAITFTYTGPINPGGPAISGWLPGLIPTDATIVYQLHKDTLILGTSIADGPTYQYVRIN